MEVSPQSGIEKNRDPLDALRDWYHLVPENVRRMEYEFFKYFRTKKMVHAFGKEGEYTKEQEDMDWDMFRESFLRSTEKRNKLQEIIAVCKSDLPIIKESICEDLKLLGVNRRIQEPLAIIMGGSAVIGPRDVAKDATTDIDLYVIMKNECFVSSSLMAGEQIFGIKHGSTEVTYQIIFIGEDDVRFPSFMPVHILAQPHIVIDITIDEGVFSDMKTKVVESTIRRLPELNEKLSRLHKELDVAKAGSFNYKS